MSSSDESEDDELSKKISAAVGDEGLFYSSINNLNKSNILSCSQTSSKTELPILQTTIGSYTDDVQECGGLLNTTPGFRDYIAKQLSLMLDKKLSESLSDNVWKCTQHPQSDNNVSGIKLFSNSQVFLLEDIEDNDKKEKPSSPKEKHFKKRKKSMISSSESSEDENINACVFTPADIERENRLLARLQHSSEADKLQTNTSDSITTESSPKRKDTEKHTKCKKKKKKRKDQKNHVH